MYIYHFLPLVRSLKEYKGAESLHNLKIPVNFQNGDNVLAYGEIRLAQTTLPNPQTTKNLSQHFT